MLDEKYNFKNINTQRESGVLMHITSLPSPYGIGTIGKEARDFVDFLEITGQTYWQMLPVGPTGYGDSPYQSFSTYAGNPYLVDLDTLRNENLLTDDQLYPLNENINPEQVDYGRVFNERFFILRKAYEKFDVENVKFKEFCEKNSFWLDDYALYMSLKDHHNGSSWLQWPDEFKNRKKTSLKKFEKENLAQVNFHRFIQFKFFEQWEELKKYIHSKNIKTIGDLPIYVAEDSADTWANPQLFQLEKDLTPKFVGGCPPDQFSDDGQLWGNPCYAWDKHKKQGYKWWIERMKWAYTIFDCIRIDHFRGFESYWKIPFGEHSREGKWEKGPAIELFNAIKNELGNLPVIAEDLGYMTEEVYEFRKATGYPGMKILQFAFNPSADSEHLMHNIDPNTVVYTGTHDNEPVKGWLEEVASEGEREFAQKYLNLSHEEGWNWGIMRGAMTSVANIAILQMQDLLELDNWSRMNSPGRLGGNWAWRMKPNAISEYLINRFSELTRISGRKRK